MTLSVDLMRRIDRYAGIPLCALMTPFVRIAHRFRRRGRTSAPKRVLFIELSEMGSAILADPAMRKAREQGAELYFLIFKDNAKSLNLLQTVAPERILTIDASNLVTLTRDTFSCLRQMRKLGIDTVIDLELFSRYTALLTGMSGAQRRVGFHNFHGEGLWRGDMLTRKVLYNPHMHIASNFLSLVYATWQTTPEVPYSKVHIHKTERRLAQAHCAAGELNSMREFVAEFASRHGVIYEENQPLILLNVNASELLVQRRWPQIQFARLADELLARWPNALILLTGSNNEHHYVEQVRLLARETRVLNFCGQVEFDALVALYGIATVMVTNDSGPAHFASVTNLRTVVLFGPETPDLYGPLGEHAINITASLACSPCVSALNHRKTPYHDNVCMQMISVEQVLQKTCHHIEARL